MSDLWQPLRLSLTIASLATLLALAVAVPLGYLMSRRHFRGRSLVEAMITLPLVLPPTVVGYLILLSLGTRSWIGAWLRAHFDFTIVFSLPGAVLAATTVAMPLLYLPARAGFASVERDLEDVARMLGAGRLRMFWRVSLPLASRGIASGLLLAFARAMGEFGATMMVFGWQRGNVTLPISVYADYEQNDFAHARPAVAALIMVSLALILFYNRSTLGTQRR